MPIVAFMGLPVPIMDIGFDAKADCRGLLFTLLIIYWMSLLVPVIIGVYGYRRLRPEMKLLLGLFAFALFIDILSYFVASAGRSNNWLHYLYFPVECAIIALIFTRWQTNSLARKLIVFAAAFIILFHVISAIFLVDIRYLNSYAMTLLCLFYAVLSSYSLYELQRDDIGTLFEDYRFWVSAALFLYSGAELVYFAFNNIFLKSGLWYAHILVNIVTYAIFTVGFICNIRRYRLPGALSQ